MVLFIISLIFFVEVFIWVLELVQFLLDFVDSLVGSDSAFSTDTGLELLVVAEPVSGAGSSYNLQPALKGGPGKGVPIAPPMAKSVSFL